MSIAAASVIAKVTRDRIMKDLDQCYPGYGWAQNAGYGTKQHMDALTPVGGDAGAPKKFRAGAQDIVRRTTISATCCWLTIC